MNKDSYHHGDLRAALLDAAEAELAETGAEGFSLRRVAKRTGVSHAAPAHHFGDARGLLTALTVRGYERFLAAMRARQAESDPTPEDRLQASGLAYLEFAEAHPALFRIMFGSQKVDYKDPALTAAAHAAFLHLVEDVSFLRGTDPFEHPPTMADVIAIWSMVHGFSELMISGQLQPMGEMNEGDCERLFLEVFTRTFT